MISINVTIDRQELTNVLDIPADEIDDVCHGQTEKVLEIAADDIKNYMLTLIANNDYDIVLALSEAIDQIQKEEINALRRQAKEKKNAQR